MARVTVEEPEEQTSPVENVQPMTEQPTVEQPSAGTEESMSPPEPQQPPVVPEGPSQTLSGPPHRKIPISPKQWAMIGVAAVILLLLFMLISANQERDKLKQEAGKSLGAQSQAEDEAKALQAEIGKFLELPSNETPTVATVSDASKVKNQAFFANSQNGDKVLIFSKAGKAVLYRPATKKIIEVAPINLNNPPTTPAAPAPAAPTTNRR